MKHHHEIRLKVLVRKNKRGDMKLNPALRKLKNMLDKDRIPYYEEYVENTTLAPNDNFLPKYWDEIVTSGQCRNLWGHQVPIDESWWLEYWKGGKFNLSRQDRHDIAVFKWTTNE